MKTSNRRYNGTYVRRRFQQFDIPAIQTKCGQPNLDPFRRTLDEAPRLRDLSKNFRQTVEADIMPFLVVCAAASADRRGEGFAAHVEFRKVYRVVQRFVSDAGSLSIPADVGRLRGIRDETVAIDTMTSSRSSKA